MEDFDKVCTQFDSKGYLVLPLSVAELDKVCTQFNGFQTLLPFSVTESVHNSMYIHVGCLHVHRIRTPYFFE